jgi:hypothetical protein
MPARGVVELSHGKEKFVYSRAFQPCSELNDLRSTAPRDFQSLAALNRRSAPGFHVVGTSVVALAVGQHGGRREHGPGSIGSCPVRPKNQYASGAARKSA